MGIHKAGDDDRQTTRRRRMMRAMTTMRMSTVRGSPRGLGVQGRRAHALGKAQARGAHVVMAAVPSTLPSVDFRVRVRDESVGGDNPFTWKTFTPTCSTYQLPGFEKNAEEFKKLGIDEIYCLSVNDSFVMNKWAKDQDLKAVKVIPDGSLAFTNAMDMNVQKDNHAFGQRSWRYAVVADDMKVVQTFIEPGKCDNGSVDDDPYGASSPENILKYLKGEDFDAGV